MAHSEIACDPRCGIYSNISTKCYCDRSTDNKYYTYDEFNKLLDTAKEIKTESPKVQTRSIGALVAGSFAIPGVGAFVVTAAGIIIFNDQIIVQIIDDNPLINSKYEEFHLANFDGGIFIDEEIRVCCAILSK